MVEKEENRVQNQPRKLRKEENLEKEEWRRPDPNPDQSLEKEEWRNPDLNPDPNPDLNPDQSLEKEEWRKPDPIVKIDVWEVEWTPMLHQPVVAK